MSGPKIQVTVDRVPKERLNNLHNQALDRGVTDATPQEVAWAFWELKQLRTLDDNRSEDAVEKQRAALSVVLQPLFERLDAAEKRAAEMEAKYDAEASKRREETLEEHRRQVDETRRRFRASLIMEALGDLPPHELGEYCDDEHRALTNLEHATEAADAVLSRCNLSGGETL